MGRFLSRRTPVRAHRSKALLGISGCARAGGPRPAASPPLLIRAFGPSTKASERSFDDTLGLDPSVVSLAEAFARHVGLGHPLSRSEGFQARGLGLTLMGRFLSRRTPVRARRLRARRGF